MAVARTYENMEICGEPFSREGKLYVRVKTPCPRCGGTGSFSYNPKNGTTCFGCGGNGSQYKEVRWYTDKERAVLDRAAEKRLAVKAAKKEERRVKFAARNAFGFGELGYITLFRGDANVINDWAHETTPCRARFNTYFGWFCPSTLEIVNLPETVETVKLTWNEVRDPEDAEDLFMRDEDEVRKYVHTLLYGESKSTFQGVVGEWMERTIVVKKNIKMENRYGGSNFHVMEDSDGNVYVWSTSSKSLEVDQEYKLRMKVKEHKDYEGVQQTVVYYCKEIK